ncbi:MAG: cell division protein FtsL [Acidobacteria bacterium]|nr:cell division protein FtsL [Acidobacteriota bacterium]
MTDWAASIEARNYGIRRDIDARMLWEMLGTVAALALVAGAFLFYSWVRGQIVHIGYESQSLFAREEVLVRMQKRLILEEETLRNPERIDILARNELEMAPLRPNQVILPPTRRTEPGAYALALADAGEAELRSLNQGPRSGGNRSN